MKLLAIDTSTEACSAALLINGEVLSRYELAPRKHNKIILSMADAILAEAGIALSQLDGLAFGRGPGSFTGVRISAAIIQGMALGLDLPIAPVSTLAAMAHRTYREHDAQSVLVAIDARMQEIYWGIFHIAKLGLVTEIGTSVVCPPSQVDLADTHEKTWVAAGTGWDSYQAPLTQALGLQPHAIYPEIFPHSHDIVLLGHRLFEQNQAVTAEQAMPVYLRDQVAKKSC